MGTIRRIGDWSPEKDEADLVVGYIVEMVEGHHIPGNELVQWNIDDTKPESL